MNRHKNARLTLHCRKLAVRRIEQEGWAVSRTAMSLGVSERTIYRVLKRYRAEGEAGLADRSSRPRHVTRATPAAQVERIEALRRRRRTVRDIADEVGVPRSTVARLLAARGLSRLKSLDPPIPVRRYEWPLPGDMIHMDSKKLGRIGQPGHRVNGDRTTRVRGIGWEVLHLAIDDHSRLAYSEPLPDEKRESAVAFTLRALTWFAEHGVISQRILTDNGAAYRSKLFRDACQGLGVRHLRTRPYTPRTNGKAERLVQTALREWAYASPYENSEQRSRALPVWQHHYNHYRRHAGIGYKPPISRLPLKNVLGLNS